MGNVFFIPSALSKDRNIGLDLVRCLAISLVLAGHGYEMLGLPVQPLGYFGVELFFVLSGFLIGGILLSRFNQSYGMPAIVGFWKRRWFRTLPNYFLFLAITLCIAFVAGKLSVHFLPYLVFLQCFLRRETPLMPESWSLCVEEWFYFIFPIWLFMFARLAKTKRSASLTATVSFVALILSLRILAAIITPLSTDSWDHYFRSVTLLRLDAIGIGVLLAYVNKYHAKIIEQHRFVLFCAGFAGIIAVYFLCNKSVFFDRVFMFTATSVSYALLLPFFIFAKFGNRKANYLISHYSIISYSVYLCHFSLVLGILNHVERINPYVKCGTYIAASLLLSTLVYNVFERRMTALRESTGPRAILTGSAKFGRIRKK